MKSWGRRWNKPYSSISLKWTQLWPGYGILAYTFQIYFDFSGYSDMAIGLGRMMGFKFPENFDSPYTSRSITEFWQRWHITLGRWMRDYLYIPLGGNRVKTKARLFFNLWIVFLLSGFWHGASWGFVLWGAYHGFFLNSGSSLFAKSTGSHREIAEHTLHVLFGSDRLGDLQIGRHGTVNGVL